MVSRILLALAGFGIVMLVIRSVSGSGTAAADPGAFFPATDQESASIAMVHDSRGVSHMAHTGYDGKTKDNIYYGACDAADCGAGIGDWKKATIPFPRAYKVQLAVTSKGKPRLYVISRSSPEETSYNRTYSYGECDGDCTEAGNWTFTDVAKSGDNLISEVLAMQVPDRTFVLDAEDRPRFIYTDANYTIEPDHYGAFVMACDSNCTQSANWTETDLAMHLRQGSRTEQFGKPVIAVAANGTIGVIARVYAFDEDGNEMKSGLYYYQCGADCASKSNWTRAFVNDTGGGSYPSPTWDLAFTRDGRPRIAQFAGAGMENREDLSRELIYLWCDANCTSEASWNGSAVGPGNGTGESADLVLDDQDRPRIAMLTKTNDTALAVCNEDCESSTAKWTSVLAEPMSVAEKERPQAMPFHCDGEVWNALMPSLALKEDSAMIGYDFIVSARCLYKDYQDPIPSYTFHEIHHGTRVVSVKLP